MFSIYTMPENIENKGITDHCREGNLVEKLNFQNVFCQYENGKLAFSNSSGLKLRFRNILVWLHFQISLV